MLDRIRKAKCAFGAIKSTARILGLNNCRVKLQVINSLVISTLLYGCMVFACLGSSRVALEQSHCVF